MAEGRWLPWKEQKMDIRPFPDYKELAKPLKAPPHGLEWRRLNDGAWELRTIRKMSLVEQEDEDLEEEERAKGKENEERAPEFLEHVVMQEDTLTGICMRYKVKDRELRRLNGFVGDHFRMCDTLIVPNKFAPGSQPTQENTSQQPETRDVSIQRFMNSSLLGPEEAKYYLENNGWKTGKAIAEWRAEKRWEAANIHAGEPVPPPQKEDGEKSKPFLRRRRAAARAGLFKVVAGTSVNGGSSSLNDDYVVSTDGTIEMNSDERLSDARIPLLSAAGRF